MIITQEMIDTVRPFAEAPDREIFNFNMSEIIGGNLNELSHINADLHFAIDSTAYVYIFIKDALYVSIFDYTNKKFTFTANIPMTKTDLNSNNLENYIEAGRIAAIVIKNKEHIVDWVTKAMPVFDKYVRLKEIKSDARWCFHRMIKLFSNHCDNGALDTEKTLKELWKKPNETWRQSVSETFGGKPQSFKTMRLVIQTFYDTFKTIENNNLQIASEVQK